MIDPLAGGATLSVAGLTLSVPAPGESLVLVLVLVLRAGTSAARPRGRRRGRHPGRHPGGRTSRTGTDADRRLHAGLRRGTGPGHSGLVVVAEAGVRAAGHARRGGPGRRHAVVRRHGDPGDARRDRGGGAGHRAGVGRPRMQPGRSGLMKGPGETMMAERVGGLRHRGPMGYGGGGVPGGEPQHLIPQAGRQSPRHQRQRGDRRDPEEHGRRYLAVPPPGADPAPLHVPVDALAHEHGQHAVPLLEHRVQLRAVLRPALATTSAPSEVSS